jgi:pescadillo
MAKIKKKGQAGQAKNFITRTQAVRKLQISLPDFRRLCIFKGIYPREPRNIKKANKSATHSTTFYYTKDIQYLLHEPLLAKFRDQKALSKKIARSLGRNEVQDAVRLEKRHTPKIKLDHIVRERYPTFVDALRDLDDALSLLFLFANLPSTSTVPPKIIARCQRLCHEFEHYLITSHSLRKSFLSIKGIYYQATIQGQDIMWLVPYRFVQQVSIEVDYRIMGTFVEFYCTLLGFVNYRLYTSIGLVYPPKFDVTSDDKGAELAAFTLQGRNVPPAVENGENQAAITNGHTDSNSAAIQAQVELAAAAQRNAPLEAGTEAEEEKEEVEVIDKFEVAAPEGDSLPHPSISGNQAASLFTDITVFISREAPRHPIEFLLRAFGCKRIGWDAVLGEGAFTHNETDPRITHQIVDRPAAVEPHPAVHGDATANGQKMQSVKPGYVMPGRIYVQPQWIWDCVNEGTMLPTDTYAPGATLPPHLSPWVKAVKGQYDPRATLEEQELEGEADEDAGSLNEEVEDDDVEAIADVEEEEEDADSEIGAGGMDIAGTDDDSESASDADLDGFEGFGDASDDEEPDQETLHQQELVAEAAGKSVPTKNADLGKERIEKAKKVRQAKQAQEDEEIERRKMMMSNKKRKLFEKMQYSNEKKDAEAAKLRKKRRKIERAQ